ncbi:MAG: hypothetical protein SZ59_C0002G0008 [candidate division TM6 bacterium GW2011_GWF2_28_16]|nr:MAG: hypothetical protein SZ59_C0002G0008 [candidate division TM6 bacterium GW2011_GWF2_28_16]
MILNINKNSKIFLIIFLLFIQVNLFADTTQKEALNLITSSLKANFKTWDDLLNLLRNGPGQMQVLQNQLNVANQDNENLQIQLNTVNQNLVAIIEERKELDNKLKELDKKYRGSASRLRTVQNKQDDLRGQQENIQQENMNLQEQLREVQQANEVLQRQVEDLIKDNTALKNIKTGQKNKNEEIIYKLRELYELEKTLDMVIGSVSGKTEYKEEVTKTIKEIEQSYSYDDLYGDNMWSEEGHYLGTIWGKPKEYVEITETKKVEEESQFVDLTSISDFKKALMKKRFMFYSSLEKIKKENENNYYYLGTDEKVGNEAFFSEDIELYIEPTKKKEGGLKDIVFDLRGGEFKKVNFGGKEINSKLVFSKIDMSDLKIHGLDLSNLECKDEFNLKETKINEVINIKDVIFNGKANFSKIVTTDNITFENIEFHDAVDFTSAQFNAGTLSAKTLMFKNTIFDGDIVFNDATFEKGRTIKTLLKFDLVTLKKRITRNKNTKFPENKNITCKNITLEVDENIKNRSLEKNEFGLILSGQ